MPRVPTLHRALSVAADSFQSLSLVGRHQIKLIREPMIRMALHPDEADIATGLLFSRGRLPSVRLQPVT